MKNTLSIFVFALLAFPTARVSLAIQLQDGDIVFHTSRSDQSVAIQKATHSKYSHMGIVFLLDGNAYVYEAIKTVRYTPLEKWAARGLGGHYVVKRLRDADRILFADAIAKLRRTASKFAGKPYDMAFEWSDDSIYCSELVWKIYERALGLRIGRLQKLRDFDLSAPQVKGKVKQRYGKNIPMEESVISPGEMFLFDGLVVVGGSEY